jgi:hypothetical protein
MSGFIKQDDDGKGKKKPKKLADPDEARYGSDALAKNVAVTANDYRNGVRNSSCIEEALDDLRSVISTYVTQARDGENGSGLYSSPNAHPVRVAITDEVEVSLFLEGPGIDSIADSLKRIADAMTAPK